MSDIEAKIRSYLGKKVTIYGDTYIVLEGMQNYRQVYSPDFLIIMNKEQEIVPAGRTYSLRNLESDEIMTVPEPQLDELLAEYSQI